MKYRLLEFLACPKCKSPHLSVEEESSILSPIFESHFTNINRDGISIEQRMEAEIIQGTIHCISCKASFPIIDGIPHLLVDKEIKGTPTQHKHTVFDKSIPVWEKQFQDIASPLRPKDFLGKTVLDLGCGYGRHSYYSALYGAEVLCVDNSLDALLSTRENTSKLVHRHLILADARFLPFRSGVCDIIYCYGLLHHVEDPEIVMEEMDFALSSGGALSLWVYGPRQGVTLFINNILRSQSSSMNHEQLLLLSQNIARFLRVFSHTPYRWFGQIPHIGSVLSHLPVHDHHQWPFDVVVADIYDRLRVEVRRWYTKEELEKWYGNKGYANISVRRRIRNNETFCAVGWKR
ncbi:MAG: hypothetical protein CL916_07545 [Deltaproteobacteria bacterium]|nr:hypothetical protein [Deltaproteobacteria bacterium]